METKQETPRTKQDVRDGIRKRVVALERYNYSLKPEGLKDREMEERIKKIIEQEVGK